MPALGAATDPAAVADAKLTATIPTGKGLPVVVHAALAFIEVEAFDENKGVFDATTDLRLAWRDPRLHFPASDAIRGYREWRASAAEQELRSIWTPRMRFPNRAGEPSFTERRLRVYPDGRVEVIARTAATYKTTVDVTRFPFDHQNLRVQVAVEEDTIETVDLAFSREDVEFSRAPQGSEPSGWTMGLVHLKRETQKGWNGDRYARIDFSLDVARNAGSTVPAIFIPLFASLLIPFLAVWMNRAEGGDFEVEAFELANVVIGGLFAVIALSFTVSSAFPVVAASDNTVTRLIALNYVALAMGIMITVVFYRFRLPARWFGPAVQHHLFRAITWAFPVTFVVIGLAILAAAAA